MVLASIFGGTFVCVVNEIPSNKWNWIRGLGKRAKSVSLVRFSSSCALKLCCYLKRLWSVILLKNLGWLVFGQQQLIKGQAECNLNQLILEIDLEQFFRSCCYYFLSIKLTSQIGLGYVHFITFLKKLHALHRLCTRLLYKCDIIWSFQTAYYCSSISWKTS